MKIKITLLLSLFVLVSCQHNENTSVPKFKTIMIKSNGTVETLPDIATFNINLSCLDKSIKAAKECLVVRSNELHIDLKSFGINEKDILTTAVDMGKSYTWRNNSHIFEGYRSSTKLFVTIRDIQKLDEIYTKLLENKNLDLGRLRYSHSKLDSLENEAYCDALKKSDILVDRLLKDIPETKKEILKIGNVEISSSVDGTDLLEYKQKYEAAFELSRNDAQSIAINKGMINVNATLYVEYLIK